MFTPRATKGGCGAFDHIVGNLVSCLAFWALDQHEYSLEIDVEPAREATGNQQDCMAKREDFKIPPITSWFPE
jgi:hypothetical protein